MLEYFEMIMIPAVAATSILIEVKKKGLTTFSVTLMRGKDEPHKRAEISMSRWNPFPDAILLVEVGAPLLLFS